MKTTITNYNVTINWEAVRDMAGPFYNAASFEFNDDATFVALLPEVPRVLYSYYHTGTIETWKQIILNHMISTLGSDPKEWFKMSAKDIRSKFAKNTLHLSETLHEMVNFAFVSIVNSDYYRAMNHIRSSVSDPELAIILKKALDKAKTDKIKVDSNFWKIFKDTMRVDYLSF